MGLTCVYRTSLPPVWITATFASASTVLNAVSLGMYQDGKQESTTAVVTPPLPGNIVLRLLTVVTVINLEKVGCSLCHGFTDNMVTKY
jgi:hypothetical protein